MLDQKLLLELQEYVESRCIVDNLSESFSSERYMSEEIQSIELEDFVKSKRKPTFHMVLFSYIDKNGSSDSDIYKKAGIDRRHFSKIRSNLNYQPKKNTVIALALALELTIKDTNKLLSSAGYSLSDSDTSDLVIQFCLEKQIYNLQSVNQALDCFSLKPLCGVIE